MKIPHASATSAWSSSLNLRRKKSMKDSTGNNNDESLQSDRRRVTPNTQIGGIDNDTDFFVSEAKSESRNYNLSRQDFYSQVNKRTDAGTPRRKSAAFPPVLEIDKSYEKKISTLKVRSVWTIILVLCFLIIISAGHLYCSLLVMGLIVGIYHEIISLKRKRENNKKLPQFFFLRWYWFFVFIVGIGVPWVAQHLSKYDTIELLLSYHSLSTFCLAFLGFVWFILSLRQYTLRYQFSQFAIMLFTLTYVVWQALLYISNIYHGMLWFILPSSLVIINDVSAYLCGLTFGRTRLIKLSPKKTVEGYIGASVVTLIWSVCLTWWLQRYKIMICPQEGIDLSPFSMWWKLDCSPSDIFMPVTFALPQLFQTLGWSTITMTPAVFHSLIIGAFAAFCAPFGGFFASAFKRAVKIKDFGDSIPGHGGITDRFDCQILMGVFTYFYAATFVARPSLPRSASNVLAAILSLSTKEQVLLFKKLSALLHKKNIIAPYAP
ncbi:phosphatidate cytidylyltransferase [Cardiosporidium cionae]|uniref:Phosphatidate cytidylyltransferase n=1 Tax=Cardiosporidium cionae TaxID=476202 RepID=A0ABQ7J8P2_9APIC|nr:phosphatidate cytidylyltransferase [Cardiosporidium cionae]|eukprot:KAF8820030.1 phosphatidate cytidylyltransferase [Cardiosporidium cionae]